MGRFFGKLSGRKQISDMQYHRSKAVKGDHKRLFIFSIIIFLLSLGLMAYLKGVGGIFFELSLILLLLIGIFYKWVVQNLLIELIVLLAILLFKLVTLTMLESVVLLIEDNSIGFATQTTFFKILIFEMMTNTALVWTMLSVFRKLKYILINRNLLLYQARNIIIERYLYGSHNSFEKDFFVRLLRHINQDLTEKSIFYKVMSVIFSNHADERRNSWRLIGLFGKVILAVVVSLLCVLVISLSFMQLFKKEIFNSFSPEVVSFVGILTAGTLFMFLLSLILFVLVNYELNGISMLAIKQYDMRFRIYTKAEKNVYFNISMAGLHYYITYNSKYLIKAPCGAIPYDRWLKLSQLNEAEINLLIDFFADCSMQGHYYGREPNKKTKLLISQLEIAEYLNKNEAILKSDNSYIIDDNGERQAGGINFIVFSDGEKIFFDQPVRFNNYLLNKVGLAIRMVFGDLLLRRKRYMSKLLIDFNSLLQRRSRHLALFDYATNNLQSLEVVNNILPPVFSQKAAFLDCSSQIYKIEEELPKGLHPMVYLINREYKNGRRFYRDIYLSEPIEALIIQ